MPFVNYGGMCANIKNIICVRKEDKSPTDTKKAAYKVEIVLKVGQESTTYSWSFETKTDQQTSYDELTAKIIAAEECLPI